jgi:hypothetical protein
MALGEGGLDAQVEQRMDAYRGNPQQLQKRYGANKELLDLLALQKLTSEKKAVAADMQMKMQQQPGTIAQQREQEALNLTKQEMGGTLGELAGRTKGTLDQKQKMQQQNMRRMAKAQPRKPAGIAGLPGLAGMRPQPRRVPPPQAQGLAGARMAQAAAQGGPKRMAGGGIVSFAEGDQVSSPISRFFEGLTNKFNKRGARNKLEAAVRQKYGPFASADGLFTPQSREQLTYAKDVISMIDSLSDQELQALANAPFTSGMSTTEISALPALPLSDTSEEVTEDTITDTSQTDALDPTSEQQPPTTGTVTFAPVEQKDFFEGVPTSFEPVTPDEADKSALEASIAAMTDQAGKTPTMGDVTPLEPAPLEAVAAPFTESEQKLSDELTERYVADSNTGVAGALRGARADSDVYFDRAGKAKTYAQQEADERALQAETLDPDRLKKLARMQTLAGGRRGAGGIGQAYVDAQLGQDKRRSAGLTTLRGIQDTGILSDTNIATYGATAGQNAAQRAEARRVSGMTGLQGLLNQAQERALQGQSEQNAINRLIKQYEQDVAKGDFNAAREALNRQGNALRKIVEMNIEDINNQVNRSLSISEDENRSRKAAVEAKLEVAKAKSKERLELSKELFNNEVELQKLADARAKTVTEAISEAMNNNPLVMQLQAKLNDLAGSENEVEFRETEAQLKAIERATIAQLAGIYTSFADAYTDMITLNERIQQIRAANSAAASTRSEVNPNDVDMETLSDFQPPVPNPTGPR